QGRSAFFSEERSARYCQGFSRYVDGTVSTVTPWSKLVPSSRPVDKTIYL
ncbi:unnamed protein product, partial [Laminaria digitata]